MRKRTGGRKGRKEVNYIGPVDYLLLTSPNDQTPGKSDVGKIKVRIDTLVMSPEEISRLTYLYDPRTTFFSFIIFHSEHD